jgi:hypothetical protein
MKKLIAFLMLAILLASVGTILVTDDAEAGRFSSTYVWEHEIDSTKHYVDTNATYANNTNPLFRFTDLSTAARVDLWFRVTYDHFDTGTTGAVPDTAKDTVWYDIFSADESGTPNWVVATGAIAAMKTTAASGNTNWLHVTIPNDSTLGDAIYARFRSVIWDSTNTKARIGGGAHYQASFKARSR